MSCTAASFIAESSFKNIETRLLSDSNHEASIFVAKNYASEDEERDSILAFCV